MEQILKLSRDLASASTSLSRDEARFLVDAYYIIQNDRMRSANQIRAFETSGEPHALLSWFADQNELLEGQIKKALDKFSISRPIGKWLRAQFGIGPVIAAGLIAHIDIAKAPTAGHIWRFAGLDPTMKWEKGKKRPWNGELKTLCWKIGQSFMKMSYSEDCYYGRLYRERKEKEIARNESGGNAETARLILNTRKVQSKEMIETLQAGKLSAAHIDARARRYVVKLFLSHLQLVWWFIEYGELPPKPYIIDRGHAHIIKPQMLEVIPKLEEELRIKGW